MKTRLMNPRLRFVTEPGGESGGGTETPPAENTETPAAGEGETPPAAEGETPPAEESETLSHEDALKALAAARREAAGTRVRLREVEDKLKVAKTPEEFEAALQEHLEKAAALEKELITSQVVAKYDLPDDLVALLRGETKEELEASAKVLAKYAVPADTGDPDGGLTPNSGDSLESLTPAELSARIRNAR